MINLLNNIFLNKEYIKVSNKYRKPKIYKDKNTSVFS